MAKFLNHFYNTGRNSSSGNLHQNRSFFQAKLSVNQSNDIYEQEANAVAERINQPGNAIQQSFFSPVSIQRKCAHCEAEEEKIQRKENSDPGKVSLSGTESYIGSLSGGKPLGSQEKTFFESKIGYDFSDVRIHADSSANQSAKNINALAYTHGNNIVFNAGQYQPNTNEGKQLLAHELTHVIQQRSSNQASNNIGMVQMQPKSPKHPGKVVRVEHVDKYRLRPPGPGAFSVAEYEDWASRHPHAKKEWVSATNGKRDPSKKYTPEELWRKKYFYAKMAFKVDSQYDLEVWLNDEGDGTVLEIIYRLLPDT